MDNTRIAEVNRMIAISMYSNENIREFVKDSPNLPDKYFIDVYRPHLDWSVLMPILEQIWKTDMNELAGGVYDVPVYPYPRTFGMLNPDGVFMVRLNGFGLHCSESLIHAAWMAAADFIVQVEKK